jgi:hypothetical protein
MHQITFFLGQSQYDWLANRLPAPAPRTRPPIPNEELLCGVLYVLKTGGRIYHRLSVPMDMLRVGGSLISGGGRTHSKALGSIF